MVSILLKLLFNFINNLKPFIYSRNNNFCSNDSKINVMKNLKQIKAPSLRTIV